MGEAGLVSRAAAWVRWYAAVLVVFVVPPVWVVAGVVTRSALNLAAGVFCGLVAAGELLLWLRAGGDGWRALVVPPKSGERFPLRAASLSSGVAIGAALISESSRTGRGDLFLGIAFVVASVGALGEYVVGRWRGRCDGVRRGRHASPPSDV